MELKFAKYSAAGNDFIVVDGWNEEIKLRDEQIVSLCDRRFGIGADGVLILTQDLDSDFRMNYFNGDGSRGEMCGNGARSITHFAKSLGKIGEAGEFLADDGLHAYLFSGEHIEVEIKVPGTLKTWEYPEFGCGSINTGVPHLIYPVEAIHDMALQALGLSMNSHPAHPQGTNLNLLSRGSEGGLDIRTWERGVNQETLACGTGATAAAIFAHEVWKMAWPLHLNFKGGQLSVDRRGNQYWLGGPVELVFTGQVLLS